MRIGAMLKVRKATWSLMMRLFFWRMAWWILLAWGVRAM